jgi:hypothetical protein
MTNKMQSDFDLDALFAAEKRRSIEPSSDLMSAILADADHVHQARNQSPAKPKNVWWRQWVGNLGGWQAVATFASCACFGAYIGYASPATDLIGVNQGVVSENYEFDDSFSIVSEFEQTMLEG